MKCDMAGVHVMLAMPTHRDINALTVRSLLETQGLFIQRGIPLDIEIQFGSSLIQHVRSKVAHRFLQSKATRLFWVDSDIVWKGSDFLRLVAMSSKLECVCGSYTRKSDPPEFMLNLDAETVETNEYGCIPIKGAGLGFTCVHRHVVERLAGNAPRVRFPDMPGENVPHIFRCDEFEGEARGEDMAFFADVRALGYTVNLDPAVTLGHVGSKVYEASFMDVMHKAPSAEEKR